MTTDLILAITVIIQTVWLNLLSVKVGKLRVDLDRVRQHHTGTGLDR